MKNNNLYLKNDKKDISYFEKIFSSFIWIVALIAYLGIFCKLGALELCLSSFIIAYCVLSITKIL